RTVEDDAAQTVGVTSSENLADISAVAVAVVVDLGNLQRIEHRDDVADGERRAVEPGLVAELLGTGLEPGRIIGVTGLNLLAVERTGSTRAALVDDHDVATVA